MTLSERFQDLKARYAALIEEFGGIALGTYFTIFFGTWFSFWLAIRSGVSVEGATAGAGTIGGAYLATKLTQPLRIGATLLLTPVVFKLWHKVRPPAPQG